MSTNTVSASTTSSGVRTLEDLEKERKVTKNLGKDQFLQILAMQLANQDPLEPASDTDFIAQMAQFSSLEQMQSLNSGFTTNQAYNLLGKYVCVSKEAEGSEPELVYGKVDGVVKEDGVDYLVIGDEKFKVSDVQAVMDIADPQDTLDEKILASANLIGKTVSAVYMDSENKEQTITGQVLKIAVKDGALYATVTRTVDGTTESKEVLLSNIKEINS